MYLRAVSALFASFAVLASSASAGERAISTEFARFPGLLWQPTAGPDGEWPSRYAAAMLSYSHFARSLNSERSGGAYPMLPGSTNLNGIAWVWAAPDGSHVQRVGGGVFRLYLRDRSAAWYRVIDCHSLAWPDFSCSDGRDRKMSAPTPAQMTFDGKEFERIFAPSWTASAPVQD